MCFFLRPKIEPAKILPTSTKQIEVDELNTLLRGWFPNAKPFMGEGYRYLCSYDDVALFLAQDQTNKYKYIADEQNISSYDCNVFTNRLLGQFSIPMWADLTFGKIWLSNPAHALNCMITEDKKFFYVEPQNDKLLPYNHYDPTAAYFIEM